MRKQMKWIVNLKQMRMNDDDMGKPNGEKY